MSKSERLSSGREQYKETTKEEIYKKIEGEKSLHMSLTPKKDGYTYVEITEEMLKKDGKAEKKVELYKMKREEE